MKTAYKTHPKSQVLIEANRFAEAGLSPIPIKADGTKSPSVKKWTPYKKRIATPEERERLFSSNGCGIGIVMGAVSGHAAVIDVEERAVFESFERSVKELGRAELLEKLPIVDTPRGGAHVYVRVQGGVGGSKKLGQRKVGKKVKTLIETRAEGAYVIVPGSCIPSAKVGQIRTES